MGNVAQLFHKYVGRKALLTVCHMQEVTRTVNGEEVIVQPKIGIQVPVTIVDARECYGKEHVLVRPRRGVGSTWVEAADRITIVVDWPDEQVDSLQQEEEADANKADE